MNNFGPFNTFQHKTIIRNQIAFMIHSQYPIKSSKDTFYFQDTFVSLRRPRYYFQANFFPNVPSNMIWNNLPNFQEFWAKIWDFNPNFQFLMKSAVKQIPTIFMNMSKGYPNLARKLYLLSGKSLNWPKNWYACTLR